MNWDDMQVFLTVARQGSFGDAAKVLKVSYTTVARRVDSFEKELGAALFIRGHGELTLTAEGREVMTTGRKMARMAAGLERRLQGVNKKVEGDITVTLAKAVFSGLLAPRLPGFKSEYPDLNVEFDTSRGFLDIMKGQADVAVRLTDNHEYQVPENLIGLRLPDIHVHAFAERKLAKKLDGGKAPDTTGWIRWDRRINFAKMRAHFDRDGLPVTWTIDDLTAQHDAVRSGMGVGILPCFMGDADKTLARVYPDTEPLAALDAWVVAHPDMRRVERIRTFMHFIADCFNDNEALITGGEARRG